MKATAQTLTAAASVEKSWLAVFSDLVKARLTFLVLLTTLVGFYVGSPGAVDIGLLLHAILGTALVASGAAALNHVFGGACAAIGLLYLALAVNLLTSLLGAVTLASYLLVYTPLKRVTAFNTLVGAIPGALPPLMGWAAARGEITAGGWTLFAILFFWQLPHFLAIAWIYREQYARAGFVMLPVVDESGERTGRQAVSHALGLLPIGLSPFLLHLAGPVYLAGALGLGLAYLWFALQFSRYLSVSRARQLFLMSIIYLPLLLGVMVWDKAK
jgi:protoheme IX farnesyltransferase